MYNVAMKKTRSILVASIGAGLEYYDFVIYALLAVFISKHFFPADNQITSLLKTFGVFAIGYIMRPIGGMVFGVIGDKIGRKTTLIIAMFFMGLSTLGIGLLPTHENIGVTAAFLLILLRIIQGFSFGAELPGAITFIVEHANKNNRGFLSGLMLAFVGFGAALGSFIVYILNQFLSTAQMWEYGWRIPFIFGGVLAVVGFIMRRKAVETPLFLTLTEKSKQPIREVFFNNFTNLAKGFGILLFPACFVIFGLFLPAYCHQFFQYDNKTIYAAMTIGLLWSTILLPLFGWLSDCVGRRKLLSMVNIIFILSAVLLFKLFAAKSFIALVTFMLLYETFVVGLAACYFPLLTELFPTNIRYTGVAICYNIVFSIAGLIPFILSFLLKYTQAPEQIVWFFIALSLIALFTTLKIKTRHLKLSQRHEADQVRL